MSGLSRKLGRSRWTRLGKVAPPNEQEAREEGGDERGSVSPLESKRGERRQQRGPCTRCSGVCGKEETNMKSASQHRQNVCEMTYQSLKPKSLDKWLWPATE